MMTKASIDAPASFWERLPSSDDVEDWYEFKHSVYDELVRLIRNIDKDFADEPYRRLEELRQLRREHNLLVIADRIRREMARTGKQPCVDLRKAAEHVVDRSAHITAAGGDHLAPRSPAEEKMLGSARVNWHKLLRRAGARAELRGRWGGNSKSPGTKTAVQQIARQNPKVRAHSLREHIRKRLEQLSAISHAVEAKPDSRLSRQDRLLIRELDLLLNRARTAEMQSTARNLHPSEPIFERQTDADDRAAPTAREPSSESLA